MSNQEESVSLTLVDIDRHHICMLSERIDTAYQSMGAERSLIARWEETQSFSILGVLELVSSDIQGYAAQYESDSYTSSSVQSTEHLRRLNIFKIDYFAQWYFQNLEAYPHTKQYVESLDHLRLLLIESLSQKLAAVA
ncbi:MAG: hypothetical protein AAF810_01700 [Cyanobacteria bacterium P01_D01_bin.36]